MGGLKIKNHQSRRIKSAFKPKFFHVRSCGGVCVLLSQHSLIRVIPTLMRFFPCRATRVRFDRNKVVKTCGQVLIQDLVRFEYG